ncbi:helix-turn-helix transcriptional regulator [Rhodococcoides kroppenstedtii]|uniref:helix-turn-helix transcriptional regulator n=1 Tax=Rhodococcoides kroppenstedtii TaxID=293050 RepID=UPI0021BF3EB6|nr:helix-turn-helix transcriptional regulator [Rhodococcus kroppenstedtii]
MTQDEPKMGHGLGAEMPQSGVRGFSPQALDDAMRRKGAGRDDLADAIGVSRQSVGSWVAGRSVPTPALLVSAARWLDLSPADLAPVPADRLRIADLRVRAGLTQREAAEALDVGSTTITEVERGRRQFKSELGERMAEIYGVDYSIIDAAWKRTVAARQARLDSL